MHRVHTPQNNTSRFFWCKFRSEDATRLCRHYMSILLRGPRALCPFPSHMCLLVCLLSHLLVCSTDTLASVLRAKQMRRAKQKQNKNKIKQMNIRTRHARARLKGAWGCEGVPTRLLANREPRRRESVSYGVSFEPLWAKYDDILRCYMSTRAKTRGKGEI